MSSTHEIQSRASASPGHAAPPSAEPEHSTGHSMVVGAILAVLVVSTLMMVGFIWYRAYGMREPTTAIYLTGDESLRGTVVTIGGMGREPIISSLKSANNYSVAALLEPGIYRVSARHGEQLLFVDEVEVKRFFGPRFDLSAGVKQMIAEGKLAPLTPLPEEPEPTTP